MAQLSLLDLPVMVLTGDDQAVAEAVCRDVGISTGNCHGRLLPGDKLQWIHSYSSPVTMPGGVGSDVEEGFLYRYQLLGRGGVGKVLMIGILIVQNCIN